MDFANTSGIKSPFSPRVRQSITGRKPIGLSGSAKKNHGKYAQTGETQGGDVIYKTPSCTVETYGPPLPVMVTETLTFASGDVTVRMSPCGWCWLVAGRRILAWPREHQAFGAAPSPAPAARELTLPQTDLSHKADLVVIYYENDAQMPSCIGVSPEGIIRYWPSIAQEGVYADVSTELAGQECEKLAMQAGVRTLALATTTCTIVLLNPAVIEGRAAVRWRVARAGGGWLGAFGRRVSLLVFGAMPAAGDARLVGLAVLGETPAPSGEPLDSDVSVALVAGGGAGPLLQLWRGQELHAHSLRRALLEQGAEAQALDARAGAQPHSLLLLLAMAARAAELRYAVAHVCVAQASAPQVLSLLALRSPPEAEPPLRFLPLGARALLYSATQAALAVAALGGDKPERLDAAAEGDALLGAELCGGKALLFSRKHGVLALAAPVHHNQSVCDSPMASPCPSDMYDGNLSLYEIDPHEVSMVTTDACGKLKTAFLFHVRREPAACRALLDELFPLPPPSTSPHSPHSPHSPLSPHSPQEERDVDAVLDRTVLKIATEILDDIPAGDPRWKQRVCGRAARLALGASSALDVSAQLRDKRTAFALFLDFLRAAGLYARLGLVTDEGGVVRSASALARLGALLAAAEALRRLHKGPDAALLDAAVHQVVCGGSWGESDEVESALAAGALTPADVCYRRVSRILRVLRALAADAPAHDVTARLNVVTTVLAAMRQTGSAPARALAPALVELHRRAVTQCARELPSASARSALLEAAASLAELLLSEAQALPPAVFEGLRRDLLLPHVEEGQIERAATLAEKFQDFELLIEMCVKGGDLPRLFAYIDKYTNEGMMEATFLWLCAGPGPRRGLLLRALGARFGPRLARWLAAAPAPPRPQLLALLRLSKQQHAPAAAAYCALAAQEIDSVGRMATTASLAKLCLAASDDDSQPSELWNKIESCLSLADQHTSLPRDIRIRYGLDTEDTKVLPPEELVQMYIECDSPSLTEYDYKKALDLTDYIQDMERRDELRLRTWCACLLGGAAAACGVDADPQQMMFFRLVDLVHVMGGDLELLLPPLEDVLTAPELAELVSDAGFHFRLKKGYQSLGAAS